MLLLHREQENILMDVNLVNLIRLIYETIVITTCRISLFMYVSHMLTDVMFMYYYFIYHIAHQTAFIRC